MGTSTQHPQHTQTPNTVVSATAVGGGVVGLCRRDSGGSSGTQFLTNNNVTVRGRCSPVTSCGHADSKKDGKEGGRTKVDLDASSSDCSVVAVAAVASDDGEDANEKKASLEHSMEACTVAADRMNVDEEEDCDVDAISTAATLANYSSSEDDEQCCLLSGNQEVATVSPCNDKMDCHNHESMSCPLPFLLQGQQHPTWNNHRLARSAPPAFASPLHSISPSAVASASTSTASSPSAKALQSMQRVITLNQSAVNHFLTSASSETIPGGTSTAKTSSAMMVEDYDDWALEDLHRAEWVRCHLIDELESSSSADAFGNVGNNSPSAINNSSLRKTKRSCNGSVKKKQRTPQFAPRSRSSSFTSGILTLTNDGRNDAPSSMSRPNQMRRVGSFGTTISASPSMVPWYSSSLNTQDSMTEDDEDDTVARTSYIYQRMDFDEGMHSFAQLESIDPAAFWVVNTPNVLSAASVPSYGMSPVVKATLIFNVGQVHRRKGDLDAASNCYDRALDILQHHQIHTAHILGNHIQHQHPIMIPILHNIGQLQYRRGDIHMAMETYDMALQYAREMYGGRHPHVASALNCLGVLYYHDANSSIGSQSSTSTTSSMSVAATSVVVSEQSREVQQQQCESLDIGESSSEDETSNKHKRQQQENATQQAMSLFQNALSIRLSALGPIHVDVATILNNIGRIHVQLDEFDCALGYYEDALRIRRDSLGADSLDYAATAFNAGQSFHQKGELGRAAELYHEFLRVALMKFGHGHRDVAVVLSGIAQIHQEKREYDKAQELYEASLCAGKAALGEDHSEIAMLLNRMGNFHFERERLDEALRCYMRGLRIERRVLPSDHPNIVVTLSNLGEIHRQRNEWDEAAKMYGDCLDILRKKHDNEDHIDVASTLSTIGLIHDQRGDTCLSLHYLQDALIMRRRLLGSDHLDVSATLVYIGTILYRKSVFSVAIELFTESLRIRQAAVGNDHRDVAFVLYNIALVHQQRGCYDEAIEAYGETLRIEKLVLGEKHRDVSMTLFKLGEVNKAAGDLEAALKCFKESLDVERRLSAVVAEPSTSENDDDMTTATSQDTPASPTQQQQLSPDHAAMARALNEIGNIHLARSEVVPMMEAFNEASRLYRSAGLSPNNVVVSGSLYALEVLCPEAAPAA